MRTFNRRMNYLMALLFTMLVACSQPAQEMELVDPAPEIQTDRELYLETVRTEFSVLNDVSDQSLVDLAENTCGLLDTGGTVYDVFDIANESGMPPEMSGYITGAAIAAYCPEYLDQLE